MTEPRREGFFGARFSLHPMTDAFVPVILGAIEGLSERGLEVESDDVSTYLGGDRDIVFSTLAECFARAARTGTHVVMTVLLSHGCPGEEVCELPGLVPPGAARASLSRTGVLVSCQWSLYPLGDERYMALIEEAIARGKSDGVYATGRHFVSHLSGDLADVLSSVRRSFDATCERVGHVTAHLTVSANSPSNNKRRAE